MSRQIASLHIIFLLCIFCLGEEVKIRLLQTTDVHGYYLGKDDYKGWLSLAKLIRQARREKPNHLLIDCGDTIQGSPMATIDKGGMAINLLNELKYDAWVLGNHELDFGLSHLDDLISRTKIPVLCGNFSFKKRSFPAWKVYEKQGVKIALIGLQVAYLKHWFVGDDYSDFEEEKGYDTVKRSLRELRGLKPDIIIVAAHQGCVKDERGVNEIIKICEDFPEIDIALGGHTHRNVMGKKINQTYYMQAGYHAKHLGVMDLVFDKKNRKISSINSLFLEADNSTDLSVYKKYKEDLSFLESESSKTIFKIKEKLSGAELEATTAKAVLQLTDADFFLQRRLRHSLKKGEVNLKNFFKIFPYENRVFTISVNFNQLKKIYHEQLSNKRRQSLWDRNRVVKKILPFEGKKILAINSYSAAGAGRYPRLTKVVNASSSSLKEYSVVIRDVVRDFLIKKLEK